MGGIVVGGEGSQGVTGESLNFFTRYVWLDWLMLHPWKPQGQRGSRPSSPRGESWLSGLLS